MATEGRTEAEMAEEHEEKTTTAPPPPARKAAGTTTTEETPEDVEALRAEREQLRTALAKANRLTSEKRNRLEELEMAEEERERAKLSETDRLKQERAAAQAKVNEAERKTADALAKLTQTRIDAAVERAAFNMGFEYPDLAPRLIERGRVTIDEETDRIEGVKEALERLIEDKPNLLAAPRGGGSPPRENGPRRPAGGGGRTGRDQKQDLIDELRESGNYV